MAVLELLALSVADRAERLSMRALGLLAPDYALYEEALPLTMPTDSPNLSTFL